ncbi:unnamed protein product, partial [Urochloa humidicola]
GVASATSGLGQQVAGAESLTLAAASPSMGRGRGTQSHEQSVFVAVALCIFASEGRSAEASGCAEEEKKQSKRPQR